MTRTTHTKSFKLQQRWTNIVVWYFMNGPRGGFATPQEVYIRSNEWVIVIVIELTDTRSNFERLLDRYIHME